MILIAEQDSHLVSKIAQELKPDGHQVTGVSEAGKIVSTARLCNPDVVVLDMDFPNSNSLIICNELRSLPHLTHVPVLFVTGEGSEVVDALDAGGDDLVTRPVEVKEVAARIRALLRRSRRVSRLHSLRIDTVSDRVWVNDTEVALTPTEFQLLSYLCEYRTQYHNASELLEQVWKYPPGTGDTALVRNHVHNLRSKLENVPNRPQIIVSLHGRGYRVNANIEQVAVENAS